MTDPTESDPTDEQIRSAVRELADDDNRAPCRALLELAERLGTPPARIGAACNELGVRVRGCQLGCFR